MKAIQITRHGGSDVLQYVELPTPVPGPNQVLIKSHASGVAMPDVLIRKGTYNWIPPLPAIPGIEMSGTVTALGSSVRNFTLGQNVYVCARDLPYRGGCYAEYLAADAAAVQALAQDADLDAAAALSNYQVSWHLLHTAPRGMSYETVIVYAAAGGIGTGVVQLAKAAGKKVIAVVGSDQKAQFAKKHGADVAINYRTANVAAEVDAATGGRGADLVLDPVGGAGLAKNFDHVSLYGMLVLFGNLGGPVQGNLLEMIRAHSSRCPAFRMFTMHSLDKRPEIRAETMRKLLSMFAEGSIKPPIHARLPLAEARRAHDLLEGGEVLGKLILKP